MTRSLWTQEIHFGRKTNAITKFSALDEKIKFRILDEKWPTKDEKWPTNRGKNVKFFHSHWHYHTAFTGGLKERTPRINGMRMD